MEHVFGLPAGPLAVGLAVALAVSVGAVSVMAVRNHVFLKIGVRNIPRRRGRSALIVLGLMLGTTIIASALFTGDTMATAVRSAVVESLGVIDETVTAGTDADVADDTMQAAKPYFAARPALDAVEEATADLPVDGVLSAIIEPIAAQHTAAGRTEPRVVLFAPDPDRAEAFGFDGLAALVDGDVALNDDAARELEAPVGSSIVLLAGDRLVTVQVAAIAAPRGTTTDGPAVVMSLTAAQRLFDRPDQVNHILVSNDGTATSGATLTDQVEPAIDAAVAELGLAAAPTKRDGLDMAEVTGDTFVQLFTTFGSFSMAAGVLLIFLIFVMLAAERRPEMGMARAVGTQRRHLVQTFVYEGAVYDLAAAAVGAVLGIGVSFVMVQAVAKSFAAGQLDFTFTLTGRSMLIAYAIGVLLTLVVVTLSARRVSRLNIVSAIRDLPESDEGARRRGRWLRPLSGVLVGSFMAVSGATGHVYLPWMLGVSVVILSLVPLVKMTGRSERGAYTAAGTALVVFWLLPLGTFDSIFGEMSKDFSIWIASGLIIVIAATWLVTYNADVFLGAAARAASPFRSLRPIARISVAYPLRSRFRTGVTMAMFMLVVFTLVTGSTIPTAFVNSFDDLDRFGGGFDIRATTAPAAAVADLSAELPESVNDDITAIGGQSFVPVEARQSDSEREAERYPLRGVDAAFMEQTTYAFAAIARGYSTPRDVWDAMGADATLAVVDAFVAPRRDQWGFAVAPDFQLSGFYIEDGAFAPVPVVVHDPLTGRTLDLTVIGVLSDNVPLAMGGITVSQDALGGFGERATPTVHHLAIRDGADATDVAGAVEAALVARGLEAETYTELLDEAVGSSMLFIRLVQGFMALGMVVGVAALGVVSARAVVERRQQLGMLRAIGFQAAMIRRMLLAETSVIALTAIFSGTALGLVLSYNVIADAKGQMGYADIDFAVPWLSLAMIFAAVLIAAVLTTMASAARATRIYPAEALRYQ